jgi:hypothetical protein
MPSSNPFYIGYYPGDPIPRKPRGGGGKYIPRNYEYDEIIKWINEIDFETTNLPNVVKDEIVQDIKRQLRVSARPQTAGYDVQKALMFGDIEETPGVQLELNLNPQDWAEDPEKEAKKTLDRWKGAILNWTDWRNWAEERYFWEPILAGRDKLDPEGQAPLLEFQEEVAMRYMGYDHPYSTGLKPFQLDGIGVERDADWLRSYEDVGGVPTLIPGSGKEDVYNSAAGSFLNFTKEVESTATRNRAFNDFRMKSAIAVRTELNEFYNRPDIISTVDPALLQEVKNFSAAVEAATAIDYLRAGYGGAGTGGLAIAVDNLSKLQTEGSRAVAATSYSPLTASGVIDKLREDVNKVRNDPNDFLRRARDIIGGHAESLSGFNNNRCVKSLEDKLNKVEEIIGKYEHQDLGSKWVLGNFKAELEGVSMSIAKGGYVRKGLLHDMLQGITSDGIVGRKSFFAGEGRLGEAFDRLVSTKINVLGENTGLENMARVYRAAERMFDKNDVKDFVSAVEGGRFFQVYVWPMVRTRLNGFTPAAQLGEALSKRHYFGLSYSVDKMEQNLREQAYRAGGTLGEGAYLRKLAHADRFARLAPENRFRLNFRDAAGNLTGVWVSGGKHFTGAKSIYKQLITITDTADKTRGLFGAVLDNGKLAGFADGGRQMMDILNGNKMLRISDVMQRSPEAIDNMNRGVRRFRIWLYLNREKLGLQFDAQKKLVVDGIGATQNQRALLQLFQQLGTRIDTNDYVNILWERAGYLQYLSAFANQIQTKLVKTVGRLMAPYVQLKNAISTAIAEASSKVITAIIAAVSGGSGTAFSAVIDKIIKPVVKFVVNYVINKAEALFKAVVKGDLTAFVEGMEKSYARVGKYVILAMIAPLTLFALLIFVMMTMLGSLPAVDPTTSGGFHTGFDPDTPPGPPGQGYPGCSDDAMGPYTNPAGAPPYSGDFACFEFVDPTPSRPTVTGCNYTYTLEPWSEDLKQRFGEAIDALRAVQGGRFLNYLCNNIGSNIKLYKARNNEVWWCGCAGVWGEHSIVYTSRCSYRNQKYLNYLFAHEAGHIFNRLGSFGYYDRTAGERTLPTYPGVCGAINDPGEDFAEIIGNWVQVNVCNCREAANYGINWGEWWDSFPRRRDFARDVLFNQ